VLIAPLSNQFPRADVQKKRATLPARGAGFEHESQLVSPLIPKATVFNNMAFDAMCHKEVRSWIVQKITLDWLEYTGWS
jgi:hypothetical protein